MMRRFAGMTGAALVLLLLQVRPSSAQFVGGFPFGVMSPFQGFMWYWPGGVPATYYRGNYGPGTGFSPGGLGMGYGAGITGGLGYGMGGYGLGGSGMGYGTGGSGMYGMGGQGRSGMGYGAGYPTLQIQPDAIAYWPPRADSPNGRPVALPSEQVWEPSALPATIQVTLPADAQLLFDGQQTRQTGDQRVFTTPPLQKGESYHYDLVVTWSKDGKAVEKKKRVDVHSGANVRVVIQE